MLSIRSSLASLATRRARTFSTQRHSLDEPSDVIRGVYVHHVTKVVLQHLQENKADWLVEQGLDRGLRLNGNGTAVLHFPSKKKGFDSGRIWTTFDGASKQHWLCLYKGKLRGRFLLKDTNMNQSQSFSNLTKADHKIRRVVDEMVRKVSAL